MSDVVNIQDYVYPLPPERIALYPLDERDLSRLLVYREGHISHRIFRQVSEFIPENSVLYFNNTKVIQARLLFQKESGASIEVFLLNPLTPSPLLLETMQSTHHCSWKCTIGNLKRWKGGSPLSLRIENGFLHATLQNRDESEVFFSWDTGETFAEVISQAGKTPLPPYLKRSAVPLDRERYQTIYSKHEGAVAAPTAGLHFTPAVLDSLAEKNIRSRYLTLHVSAGTFQPVKTENALDHRMHGEQIVIQPEIIEALIHEKGTIIAVGTTSMRTLESLYWYGVRLLHDPASPFEIRQEDPYTLPQSVPLRDAMNAVWSFSGAGNGETLMGETSIFIRPGYSFRVCDALITNFHQPASTLILLVAAFIGADWRKVYSEALENGYRFLSYGDSSLLFPRESVFRKPKGVQ